MNLTSFWLIVFVGGLCALPWLVKWLQKRTGRGLGAQENSSKLLSVLALGPQQRVMTVEVGTGLARTRLVLGVTAQSITCLHVLPPDAAVGGALASSSQLPSTLAPSAFATELREQDRA